MIEVRGRHSDILELNRLFIHYIASIVHNFELLGRGMLLLLDLDLFALFAELSQIVFHRLGSLEWQLAQALTLSKLAGGHQKLVPLSSLLVGVS